ncbi:MAG: DUF2334 domain-containing protein [Butyrivibrio sp.]|nr:DUF2334 domain-containing protein [Butyrivibrio sp.]
MKITVRLDDITPDMDWDKFLRFKEVLDKHNVKPLIGVVPDNKDEKLSCGPLHEDFWSYVKELQDSGWVIAIHGFNHIYTTKEPGLFPIGGKSEFAGQPYSAQDDMLREARRIFKSHDISTDIFMAPSHSFDKKTIKSLKKNGIYKITDGFGRAPYSRFGMTFYPISVKKSSSIKDKRDGFTTFVYHVNTMNDKDFENFEKLFEKADVVSFSEYINAEPVERGFFGNLAEFLTAKSKYTAVKLRTFLRK